MKVFLGIPRQTCNHPGGDWHPGRGRIPAGILSGVQSCFRTTNISEVQTFWEKGESENVNEC